MRKIDQIEFNGESLDIYGSLENPYFLAIDVAEIVGYENKIEEMVKNLEVDEYKKASIVQSGEYKLSTTVLTEIGLYNILSQSQKPTARMWKRIIHQQLVEDRRRRNLSIVEQFDEWDDLLDTLYIDEETGVLMQSVTVPGGDVEQMPYEE